MLIEGIIDRSLNGILVFSDLGRICDNMKSFLAGGPRLRPAIKQSITDMKPDPEEIGFVHGQSIFEWSHSSKSPHDYSLCRAARRRSRFTLSRPARTMSSTRNVYVRSLVSGTKHSSVGDPQQDACTFKEWVGEHFLTSLMSRV